MTVVQVSSSWCELTQIVEDQVFTLRPINFEKHKSAESLVLKLLQHSAGGRVMSLIIYFIGMKLEEKIKNIFIGAYQYFI